MGLRAPIELRRVRQALRAHRPGVEQSTDDGRPPAAVLVALFEEEGDTRVVLTRRSSSLRSHTGQVAFPGGRVDSGETIEQAALREAREEVGLDPDSVEVVGRLSRLSTVSSGAVMTPVVGALARRPTLTVNPAEVERVFDVALSELGTNGVHREERWSVGEGADHAVHFFEVEGETVWGATALVLHELLLTVSATPAGAWTANPSQ